jgi:transcriptional regulator with PAS, ATPase and Fis domain
MKNYQHHADAANLMSLSDDGFVVLDRQGSILEISSQAASILGREREVVLGQSISVLPSLADVVGADTSMQRQDATLSFPNGRRALVSIRRSDASEDIRLIQLCDLDTFEYRRSKASGNMGRAGVNSAARNRTRPDFKAQRRLSPELNKVLSRGERAIQQGARILITGETGVGKTEIARHLHGSVTNANDPFVVVNCAISDPAEIVAQLFGDDDGSLGYFEQAAGGTLFLDEIAELPMSAQIRLLGYLENNETGTSHRKINENARVNLISATNLDLRKLSSEGKFRSDLYYRLAIMDLKVPPLRQMPALIDHLSHRFMGTLNQRRTSSMILSKRLRGALQDYSFPGNIRELLNLIQKAAILMEDAEDMDELIGELIEPVSIEAGIENFAIGSSDLRAEVKRFEREIIDRAIKLHGSKRKAATALGVDIGTISRKTSNSNEHNEDGINPPHKQTSTRS